MAKKLLLFSVLAAAVAYWYKTTPFAVEQSTFVNPDLKSTGKYILSQS
jgi:hypothetical protein